MKKRIQTVILDLNDIHPYANNPRLNETAVNYVAQSIRDYGFQVPIVVDKDKTIICGHTRYEAALKLGLKRLPCIVADDLTEEQVNAYRLADNKVHEMSSWDFDKLQEELKSIEDIDMSIYHFFKFEDKQEETGLGGDEDTVKNSDPISKQKICTCPRCRRQWEI